MVAAIRKIVSEVWAGSKERHPCPVRESFLFSPVSVKLDVIHSE